MAWTQVQIDALKSALADGALEVEYSTPQGKKRVTYRSLAEMKNILDMMEAEVNPPASGSGRLIYPRFCKGLGTR